MVKTYTKPSDADVALANCFKDIEEGLLRLVDLARKTELDQRWVSIAATHFNEGFMALNRAVFKPQRITESIELDDAFDEAGRRLQGMVPPKATSPYVIHEGTVLLTGKIDAGMIQEGTFQNGVSCGMSQGEMDAASFKGCVA